jgi:hypothetical protein
MADVSPGSTVLDREAQAPGAVLAADHHEAVRRRRLDGVLEEVPDHQPKRRGADAGAHPRLHPSLHLHAALRRERGQVSHQVRELARDVARARHDHAHLVARVGDGRVGHGADARQRSQSGLVRGVSLSLRSEPRDGRHGVGQLVAERRHLVGRWRARARDAALHEHQEA